jgi:hypothetical protein
VRQVLDRDVWEPRAVAHRERARTWTAPHLARRERHEPHPVFDFLFEYYNLSPGQLERWHPGLDVGLADAPEHAALGAYVTRDGVSTVDPRRLASRVRGLRWTRSLLTATLDRPARYGCFGLHEWAMVYGLEQQEVRHESWPLRLAPADIRDVVDTQGLHCTHYDAFRFFTPDAVPRNDSAPTRAAQPDLDQPGCLHATMDLYKWTAKYVELVGSDLVADCFALAREARRLDMEAAPYDLAALGYEPVRIETPEGRAEYVRRQRDLMAASAPLRARTAAALTAALQTIDALAPTATQPTSSPTASQFRGRLSG